MSFTLTRRTLIGSGLVLALPAVARSKTPDLKAYAEKLLAQAKQSSGGAGAAPAGHK